MNGKTLKPAFMPPPGGEAPLVAVKQPSQVKGIELAVHVRVLSLNEILREGFWARRDRKKRERKAVSLALRRTLYRRAVVKSLAERPALEVTFTRGGPGEYDDDNLTGGFKTIRDQVAKELRRDDGRRGGIRWRYEQVRQADEAPAVLVRILEVAP